MSSADGNDAAGLLQNLEPEVAVALASGPPRSSSFGRLTQRMGAQNRLATWIALGVGSIATGVTAVIEWTVAILVLIVFAVLIAVVLTVLARRQKLVMDRLRRGVVTAGVVEERLRVDDPDGPSYDVLRICYPVAGRPVLAVVNGTRTFSRKMPVEQGDEILVLHTDDTDDNCVVILPGYLIGIGTGPYLP